MSVSISAAVSFFMFIKLKNIRHNAHLVIIVNTWVIFSEQRFFLGMCIYAAFFRPHLPPINCLQMFECLSEMQ